MSTGPETFVTLFDQGFLPMGLALHASLRRHAGSFRLWVVCMDGGAKEALLRLGLPDIVPLALAEIEDPPLLAAKADRTWREYCWTVACHAIGAVLERDPTTTRVTYLDADVWFMRPPQVLLGQLQAAGRGLLLTEHGYPPERAAANELTGRFCVQFLTVARRPRALEALAWWQERVREWCHDRCEPGRFGDQLYLNRWPVLFGDEVVVAAPSGLCLGPWNAEHAYPREPDPVMYHFHGARFQGRGRILLSDLYRLGPAWRDFYPGYLADLAAGLRTARGAGAHGPWEAVPPRPPLIERLRRMKRRWRGLRHEARLPRDLR